MIQLTHDTTILLGVAPADFRRGIDGFVAVVEQSLGQRPRDGKIFCFINRARTMIRALSYDGTGYWLMTKRLSKGRFTGWPTAEAAVSIASARELREILGGDAWVTTRATERLRTSSPVAQVHPCTTVMSQRPFTATSPFPR